VFCTIANKKKDLYAINNGSQQSEKTLHETKTLNFYSILINSKFEWKILTMD